MHIHLKVIVDQRTAVTSQLFFDEDVSDAVYSAEPYRAKGQRDVRIDNDMVYAQADSEGTPLLLTLKRQVNEMLAAGHIVIAS